MNKPNLMIKSYNYFKAVSKRILGGLENVSTDIYYDRVYICSRCPEMNEDKECNACGCPEETHPWAQMGVGLEDGKLERSTHRDRQFQLGHHH